MLYQLSYSRAMQNLRDSSPFGQLPQMGGPPALPLTCP